MAVPDFTSTGTRLDDLIHSNSLVASLMRGSSGSVDMQFRLYQETGEAGNTLRRAGLSGGTFDKVRHYFICRSSICTHMY